MTDPHTDDWPAERPTRFDLEACFDHHVAWHRPCVHVINEIARLEAETDRLLALLHRYRPDAPEHAPCNILPATRNQE